MANELEKKMCDWKMCSEKATTFESYKGQLHALCREHLRLVKKQKEADNNV